MMWTIYMQTVCHFFSKNPDVLSSIIFTKLVIQCCLMHRTLHKISTIYLFKKYNYMKKFLNCEFGGG